MDGAQFCGCTGCGVTITGVEVQGGAGVWIRGVAGHVSGAGIGMHNTEGFSGVPESQ